MKSVLEQLSAEAPDWAARRAATALELTELYQAGDISADEYRECLEDLVRTDELDAEADSMDVKSSLVSAISGLAAVV